MVGRRVVVDRSAKPSQFGPGYVRPTRAEAEDDPQKFYELVSYLRSKRRLTWKQLGDVLGIDEANALRRVNGQSLGHDDRLLALSAIFDELKALSDPSGAEIGSIRDNLYFSLVDFFKIPPTLQDDARAACVGTYQLWRHSVEGNGEYVRGRLDFEEDKISNALKVHMVQVRKPRDGMRGLTEEFTGYLIWVANMYAMLLRDVATNDMRVTLFSRARTEFVGTDTNSASVFAGHRRHIVEMDGFGMGIDGKNAFQSPVYAELVDDKHQLEKLDDQLDVVAEAEAPRRIVARLRRHPLVLK